MTKRLEDELNLPRIEEALKEYNVESEDNTQDEDTKEVYNSEGFEDNINQEEDKKTEMDENNKFDPDSTPDDPSRYKQYLNKLRELENEIKSNYSFTDNDNKMEELQQYAVEAHKDLFDIGNNVEPSKAGNYFEPGIQALNLAMDMEKTKIDKKIKFMKQKLEEEKVDISKRRVYLEEIKNNIYDGSGQQIENKNGYVTASRKDILNDLREENTNGQNHNDKET